MRLPEVPWPWSRTEHVCICRSLLSRRWWAGRSAGRAGRRGGPASPRSPVSAPGRTHRTRRTARPGKRPGAAPAAQLELKPKTSFSYHRCILVSQQHCSYNWVEYFEAWSTSLRLDLITAQVSEKYVFANQSLILGSKVVTSIGNVSRTSADWLSLLKSSVLMKTSDLVPGGPVNLTRMSLPCVLSHSTSSPSPRPARHGLRSKCCLETEPTFRIFLLRKRPTATPTPVHQHNTVAIGTQAVSGADEPAGRHHGGGAPHGGGGLEVEYCKKRRPVQCISSFKSAQ